MTVLQKTQTICPACAKPIPATYEESDGKVWFVSDCPDCGKSKTIVASSHEDFKRWLANPVTNVAPRRALTEGAANDDECPLHCGTCNNHLMSACCVLIDVTNRCNQHCPYCFASAGENEESLEPGLEEINEKYDFLRELGEERPFNIQLSGGEPTLRDDLPEIIAMGRDKGFEYIQLNSNGRRIAEEPGYADKLKDVGCSVVFMQFDGTNDDIYTVLRNEPLLEIKEKAIDNCRRVGLAVTLVPTVVAGVNLSNIGEMVGFLLQNMDVVKGIHFQPASFFGRHPEAGEATGRVTMFDVLHELEKQTDFFKYEDYVPISTGHPLCCFYSTYTKEPDGSIRCGVSAKQREDGASCCNLTPNCCEPDPLEIIKKDRDFVLDKWEMSHPEEDECCDVPPADEAMDFDEFIKYYKRNTFTITGMAFMDRSNLDAERLKRCRVQQLTDDGRLIPFCAYNSIYR